MRIGARTAVAEVRGFFTRATLTQREHYGLWGLVPAFGPVKRAAYPFRRVDADGRAWSYVAAVQRLLAEMDLENRVAGIRVPTLLVYSHADAIVPHAQGERLMVRMGRAGRRLALLSARDALQHARSTPRQWTRCWAGSREPQPAMESA